MSINWYLPLALVLALTTVAPLRAHAANDSKDDAVFMDEGDGDFDSVPKPTNNKPASKPGKKSKTAAKKVAPPPEPAPAPAEQAAVVPEEKDALPVLDPSAPADMSGMTDEVKNMDQDKAAPAQVAPPQPEPVVEQPTTDSDAKPEKTADAEKPVEKTKKPKKTASKKGKAAPGLFVVTKEACPMTRQPASDSELMITVKASKKIWVEEVDADWVKGFNKAGEAGYISRSCVE